MKQTKPAAHFANTIWTWWKDMFCCYPTICYYGFRRKFPSNLNYCWKLINAIGPRCKIMVMLNTLRRPRHNDHHFPDNSLKCIFSNENVWISIETSLNFIPKVPINNIPALVQIMVWHQPGNKPMMVSLLKHICITRPQWVKESPWVVMTLWDILTWWTLLRIFNWNPIFLLKTLKPEACLNIW